MYTPKLYREEDREKILSFLKSNNFPALVSTHEGRLTATHLPVEMLESPDGSLTIHGHLSRANPQWKSLEGQEALLMFQGPHTYISPRWYNHVNVPTWNYINVHVYGTVKILDGEAFRSLLRNLIHLHEAGTGYSLDGLPADFVEKEMRGAVGFSMEVTRLDAASKLSQNRDDESHSSIISHLKESGDPASLEIANEMQKRRP